jgi:hypothetical protein
VIPQLNDGVLPIGIHHCTFEEIFSVFGRFNRSDKRPRLTERLRQYIADARNSGIASAVIVDGSYVTGKAELNDVDVILVLRSDFDLGSELRPMEYNIQSKRAVKKQYGFDVLPAIEGTEVYEEYLQLFSQVRLDDPEQITTRTTKGLLRIEL